MTIRPLDATHRDAVMNYVRAEWGAPIVTRGNLIDPAALPGLAAETDGTLDGALLYQIARDACEIVVLFALSTSRGAGTALLDAVEAEARAQGCRRLWLITTNDNTPAIRFYQRRGFDLVAVHRGAFAETRRLKNEFPLPGEAEVLGIDDIPIRHEVELEMRL